MRASVAADAGNAVLQGATREELRGDLCDDGLPRAVRAREATVVDRLQAAQLIRHQPKQRQAFS